MANVSDPNKFLQEQIDKGISMSEALYALMKTDKSIILANAKVANGQVCNVETTRLEV